MIVIPAIDIRAGKVVRLFQGDFDKESRYADDPLSAALRWQRLGAKLIHVVDLDGALTGEPKNKDIVLKIIREVETDIEVGGGLRQRETVKEFLLAGAECVVLGSKALSDYSFLDNFKDVIGKRISISIDAKFMYICKERGKVSDIMMDIGDSGWKASKKASLKAILREFYDKGIRCINFTNIERDGTLSGVDIESIEAVFSFFKPFKNLKMIVSGGVASVSDIEKLKKIPGLYGVIVGKALYEGKLDFKEALKAAGNKN